MYTDKSYNHALNCTYTKIKRKVIKYITLNSYTSM